MKNLLYSEATRHRLFKTVAILALLSLGLMSCNSYEKVLYFKDLDKSTMHKEVIDNYTPLSIQTEDILEINVSSLSPEASAIFSFSSSAGTAGLSSGSQYLVDPSGQLLPGTCDQIRRASEKNIKDVYVSLSADRMSEAGSLILEAERQCVRLKFVPDFSQLLDSPFTINYMGEFPVFSVRNEPLEDIDNRFKKRLTDIVFSSFVIVFLLSWLFPLIAIIIKLEARDLLCLDSYEVDVITLSSTVINSEA